MGDEEEAEAEGHGAGGRRQLGQEGAEGGQGGPQGHPHPHCHPYGHQPCPPPTLVGGGPEHPWTPPTPAKGTQGSGSTPKNQTPPKKKGMQAFESTATPPHPERTPHTQKDPSLQEHPDIPPPPQKGTQGSRNTLTPPSQK